MRNKIQATICLLAGLLINGFAQSVWTTQVSGTTKMLLSVTWADSSTSLGNGRLVAVGDSGTILTSPNGINWSTENSGTNSRLNSVIWTGNQFVAVGDTGIILTSTDGAIWIRRTSGTSAYLLSVAWGSNQLVAVGSSGAILTSTDGANWTARISGTTNLLNSAIWADTQWVTLAGDYGPGTTDEVLTSPNSINWAVHNGGIAGYSITWTGYQFVAVRMTYRFDSRLSSYMFTRHIQTSPDGNTWTTRLSGTQYIVNAPTFSSVTWAGSQLLVVGLYGTILTSSDGITWTSRTSGTNNVLYSSVWTGNQFVVVGYGGTILTSPQDPLVPIIPRSPSRSDLNLRLTRTSLLATLPNNLVGRELCGAIYTMAGRKLVEVRKSSPGAELAAPLENVGPGLHVFRLEGAGKPFSQIINISR